MNWKIWLFSIASSYIIGATTPCHAVTYSYSGTVVEATGAFSQLIPVGTQITGYMVFADTAVETGFVGEDDLEDLVVQLGQICIYLQNFDCAGAAAPLDLVETVEIFFGITGNVTGGQIYGVTFVPSDPVVPWLFDFDTNTLTSDIPGFGIFTATTSVAQAIPLPGAIWMYCPVIFGVIGWTRYSSYYSGLKHATAIST